MAEEVLYHEEPSSASTRKTRSEMPLGIAILAVLNIIGGGFFFLGAFVLSWARSMLVDFDFSEFPQFAQFPQFENPQAIIDMLMSVFTALIFVAIFLGIFAVVVGWGFWKGKGWARTLGIVYYLIFVFCGIFLIRGIGLVIIVLNGVILYYLFTPKVKAWFSMPTHMQEPTIGQPPERGYEKLVDVYTRMYGADGKKKLDKDIETYTKQGLTREEAIQKVGVLVEKYRLD